MSGLASASPAPSAWRRVVGDALRFDRSGVVVLDAARMAVGTTIPLVVGYLAGSWAAGAAAAGGALAVGIGSVVPAPRPRYASLGSTAVGMAVGTFVGSASSSYPAAHVVAGAVVALVCGLLVAVEPGLAGVGINTLVAFLVYGRFSAPPLIAAGTAGLVAAGALLQLLLVFVVRRRPRVGRELTSLSHAYSELADFAADLRVERSSLPVAQAIDAANIDIEFSFRADVAGEAWTSLAGEAHRVRLELLSLASARSTFETADADTCAALVDLGNAASAYLSCAAASLASAAVSESCEAALGDVEDAVERIHQRAAAGGASASGDSGFVDVRAMTAAAALAGQLRAVNALLPDAVSAREARPGGVSVVRSATRISRRGVRGVEAIGQRMVANLTPRSDAFRHAIRLAVVVTVATAASHAVDLGRGYWLALTAVLVLRPEFSITFTRGVARAVGTVLGVAIATTIAVLMHPHGWSLVLFVACFVWLSGALFNASYAVFSIAITGVVVFLLAGIDQNAVTTGKDRLVATVLGAALALIAYAAWPTWGRRPAAEALGDLAAATHHYVIAVLRSFIEPADAATLAGLSRAVRLARTNTESALDRSLADPGPRRMDVQTTAAILASLRRLSIAAHTLRLRRRDDVDAFSLRRTRELADLVDAIDTELNGVAARLRFGRVAYRHERLRDLHNALFKAARARADVSDETAALVVAETDELVDATNSLTAVLDRAGDLAPSPAG